MVAKKNAGVNSVGLNDLLYGGNCTVPKKIAVCPECGGRLCAESCEWAEETGIPTTGGLYVGCMHENRLQHKFWQSDWQKIINAIEKWCGAIAA
jgi:hypothetical protein